MQCGDNRYHAVQCKCTELEEARAEEQKSDIKPPFVGASQDQEMQ